MTFRGSFAEIPWGGKLYGPCWGHHYVQQGIDVRVNDCGAFVKLKDCFIQALLHLSSRDHSYGAVLRFIAMR